VGARAVTAFLASVLRRSWLSVAAVPLAIFVDARRGECVGSDGLPALALVAALLLGLTGAVATVRAILRDRRVSTLVATGLSLYAITVTWLLVTV
jgi:hypothetical protein